MQEIVYHYFQTTQHITNFVNPRQVNTSWSSNQIQIAEHCITCTQRHCYSRFLPRKKYSALLFHAQSIAVPFLLAPHLLMILPVTYICAQIISPLPINCSIFINFIFYFCYCTCPFLSIELSLSQLAALEIAIYKKKRLELGLLSSKCFFFKQRSENQMNVHYEYIF